MVELEYVKKRQRKKRAKIIAAAASAGIGVFVLVAFLGRFVGTFTIALNTGDVKLSMFNNYASKSGDGYISEDEATSYIKIDSLPPFDLETFDNLNLEKLDSDDTTYKDGIKNDDDSQIMYYFKYTFYVKNSGHITAGYSMSVNITRNDKSSDGRSLDSILRVMLFENDPREDTHYYQVFAKASELPNTLPDGSVTYNEYLSYTDEPIFAEQFESNNVIVTKDVQRFRSNDVRRYTIVTWLEGEDPQANLEAPEGATLKLGVTINAYENNE